MGNLPERFSKFSSPCLQFYNLPERFSKFFSPCLHFYNLPERFSKFSSPGLQFYNPPERVFTFPPHILHSQVYQRFLQVFPLHNSTSFNLPRDLHFLSTILQSTKKHWFLSTFLHSTTYNEQPIHPNSRNKIKNEAFNNQENLAKRRRKIQEPTYSKYPLIIY